MRADPGADGLPDESQLHPEDGRPHGHLGAERDRYREALGPHEQALLERSYPDVDFEAMAQAAKIEKTCTISALQDFTGRLDWLLNEPGPVLQETCITLLRWALFVSDTFVHVEVTETLGP